MRANQYTSFHKMQNVALWGQTLSRNRNDMATYCIVLCMLRCFHIRLLYVATNCLLLLVGQVLAAVERDTRMKMASVVPRKGTEGDFACRRLGAFTGELGLDGEGLHFEVGPGSRNPGSGGGSDGDPAGSEDDYGVFASWEHWE